MRPLIQLEAESRIRLRSSWRGSGGRFEQADGRRSAGPKERGGKILEQCRGS